jgi:membrane protease YdiL (CAAX protease family)
MQQFSLQWDNTHLEIIISILFLMVGFLLFRIVSKSDKLFASLSRNMGAIKAQEQQIYYQRAVGFFFFGIFPLAALVFFTDYNCSDYGLQLDFPLPVWLWTIGLSLVLIFMVRNTSQKEKSLMTYPEIRRPEWPRSTMIKSAVWWILYLFSYELLFRGLLLFSIARALGVWPAIFICSSIYALVHVPKGNEEAIGAIPLGVVLSLITFSTGTIWVAFLVHIVLSLANEWYSLKYHPTINLEKL